MEKWGPGGAPVWSPREIDTVGIDSTEAYNPCPVQGLEQLPGRIHDFQRVNLKKFPRSEIATGLSHRILSFCVFHDVQRVNEFPFPRS